MFNAPLNLLAKYEAMVAKQDIALNPQQEYILKVLEECYLRPKRFQFPWHKKLLRKKNVYIHGTVGSGKTFVMDLFYSQIPGEKKARFHFHQFLEQIAADLRAYQGSKDPMQKIVKDLASQYQVICLDEMMVQDVVQAMLLLSLIPALMESNVMLVFTSNIEPRQLYLNGLQRERFMKVIEYIESDAYVLSLASNLDYRSKRVPLPKQTYFFPNSEKTEHDFKQLFMQLATHFKEEVVWGPQLLIQNRQVDAIAKTAKLVWFEFHHIAEIPRCQRDYLELTQDYQMVFVSNVPTFKDAETANVILWMYFIDVMYDAQVKILICADVELDALYPTGPLTSPFQRTISRMKEMQSQWYWQMGD